MSIRCPHCNFEIILAGVRPGRFSPKCESCAATFTLYIVPGDLSALVARSHLALHHLCLAKGMQPPRPFPAGAETSAPRRSILETPIYRAPAHDILSDTDAIEDEAAVALLQEPPDRSSRRWDDESESDRVRHPAPPRKRSSSTSEHRSTAAHRRPRSRRNLLTNFTSRFGNPLEWIFSPVLRVIVGALVLVAFAAWWQQNKGDRAIQQVVQQATQVTTARREVSIAPAGNTGAPVQNQRPAEPAPVAVEVAPAKTLEFSLLSEGVRRALSGWNACVAGLILVVSGFCRGRMLSLAIFFSAAVAMMGHWYAVPQVGQALPWMSAAAAAAMAAVAMFFLRVPQEI